MSSEKRMNPADSRSARHSHHDRFLLRSPLGATGRGASGIFAHLLSAPLIESRTFAGRALPAWCGVDVFVTAHRVAGMVDSNTAPRATPADRLCGCSYAAVVVVMGVMADARMASQIIRRRDTQNIVIWGNLFTLMLFTAFVSLAVAFRKRPEAHKRLTLLASMSIVGPAMARFTEWPVFPGGDDARHYYGIGDYWCYSVC